MTVHSSGGHEHDSKWMLLALYLLDVYMGNRRLYRLKNLIKCQCCVYNLFPLLPSGQVYKYIILQTLTA